MNISTKNKIFLCCLIASASAACSKVAFNPVENDSSSLTPNKSVSSSEIVAYGNKQVDFLLVLDDSNSMLQDLKKLAARMSGFVSSLDASNIDWQMCLTTTRGLSSNGSLFYGVPKAWNNHSPADGNNYLLKKGAANLDAVFTTTVDTMTIGGSNSGDERGIKAAFENFNIANSHDCYRPGAAISVILISDEDERSVGGDPSNVKANDASGSYQPLEVEDRPENLISKAQAVFGTDVRFTFNSIIVKPGDATCETEQDKDTSPSHPGYVYAEASRLTEGGVGSICDADYSANLNTFKDKIVNSLTQLVLTCVPVPDSLSVKINGQAVTDIKLDKKILKFKKALIEGTKIDLKYDCVN